jgi:hypothetical protein
MPVAFNPPPLPTHDVTARTAAGHGRQDSDDVFALLLAGLGATLASTSGLDRSTTDGRAAARDDSADAKDAAPLVPLLALPTTIDTNRAPSGDRTRTRVDGSPLDASMSPSTPAPPGENLPPDVTSSHLDTAAQLLGEAKPEPDDERVKRDGRVVPPTDAPGSPAEAQPLDLAGRIPTEHAGKEREARSATFGPSTGAVAHDRAHEPAPHPGEIRIDDPAIRSPHEPHKSSTGAKATAEDAVSRETTTAPAPHSDAVAPPSQGITQPLPPVFTHAATPIATSTAAPTPVVTITHPVDGPGFAGAAAKEIAQVVFARSDRAEIRVHPAELGPIHIRVDLKPGEASLSIIAPVAETRHALESSLPQLRELLAQGGITLGQASINDGNASARQSPHDTGWKPARDSLPSDAPASVAGNAAVAAPTGGRLLDVFA